METQIWKGAAPNPLRLWSSRFNWGGSLLNLSRSSCGSNIWRSFLPPFPTHPLWCLDTPFYWIPHFIGYPFTGYLLYWIPPLLEPPFLDTPCLDPFPWIPFFRAPIPWKPFLGYPFLGSTPSSSVVGLYSFSVCCPPPIFLWGGRLKKKINVEGNWIAWRLKKRIL